MAERLSMKRIIRLIVFLILILGVFLGYLAVSHYINKEKILNQIIQRLEADSRIAEALVTNVTYDEEINKTLTTIKFLEYDTKDRPLKPRYFTFPGNIIQFQSLVVRFDDFYVKRGDPLKGKSVYLFWKIFMLDGENTKEYDITKMQETPSGYKLDNGNSKVEQRFWSEFWEYALDPEKAKKNGIKNAQIEAPGTMFIPGTIYTLKIEHDGGIRIEAEPLPTILKGEKLGGA